MRIFNKNSLNTRRVEGLASRIVLLVFVAMLGTGSAHEPGDEHPQFRAAGLGDDPVTRYEFAYVMESLVQSLRGGFGRLQVPPRQVQHGYADIPQDHWASDAVAALVAEGMIAEGRGTDFRGTEPVDRFTLAIALDRFIKNIEPHFSREPREKTVNIDRIKGREGDGSKEAMIRLATRNFLPFGSPIFEGPEDTVHPETMAAVFAQAIERIGDVLRSRDTDFSRRQAHSVAP